MRAGVAAATAGVSTDAGCVCAESFVHVVRLAQGGIVLSWLPTLPSTRTLVIAVLAVVVVALAGLGGWAWHDASQRRVAAAYAETMARVQAADAPEAPAEVKAAAARD